jgi:fibro-slime domain-containing protein
VHTEHRPRAPGRRRGLTTLGVVWFGFSAFACSASSIDEPHPGRIEGSTNSNVGANSNTNGGASSGGASTAGGADNSGSIVVGGANGNATGGSATSGMGGVCEEADCVVGCGNGKIDAALREACDDGNASAGDGCSADCKTIERDFACPTPGSACLSSTECGDGKLSGMETCDDGNTKAADGCSERCALEPNWDCFQAGASCAPRCGDSVLAGNEECDAPNPGNGCSALCRLEPGFACVTSSGTAIAPANCRRTVCGDSKLEGAEACDDGNLVDGDGCSAACAFEPDCQAGVCVSNCGDGIKLAPEECDDGNAKDEDGCSHECKNELGHVCEDNASAAPTQLNLLVTYRDLRAFPSASATRHADVEQAWEGKDVSPGLVKATLDARGKPVFDGRCSDAAPATLTDPAICPYGQMLSTKQSFDAWYNDANGESLAVSGALLLEADAKGAYVFDSANTGFYPIDGKGFTAAPAQETTAQADPVVNDGRQHNFGFSTEIRYFFQYRGGESLTFSGDDDLWIFINRRLALDVGGLHPPVARTLDVDASAKALGLVVGGLYEVALFHAERHSGGSNFRLTLTGFAPTSSRCNPACGDGVVTSNEQCDLGRKANTGDYDGCTAACKRGPHCGDSVVQSPNEACDDGTNLTTYAMDGSSGCAPGCVPSAFCGDGSVDSLFGEQCDVGAKNGDPASGCALDCRLGARCGDGIVQPELSERCDDGNTLTADGCSHDCQPEVR